MKHLVKNALFIGVVVVCGMAGCKDSWTGHFENLDAARKDGLIDKGWIPKFIPQDATNIEVSGDLDSGITLGHFASMNVDGVKQNCSPAPDSLPIPDYALRWLNVGGAGADKAVALRGMGYEVFECGSENFDFAYLRSQHRFYYWTPRKK